MTENERAGILAHTLLAGRAVEAADIEILAREFLRQRERNIKLATALAEATNPGLDLIHANRDAILQMHEEAIRRIRALVEPCQTGGATVALGAMGCLLVWRILEALNQFHPMHGWVGWPEGTEP